MEEWVGGLWHKYITRKASTEYADAAVQFSQVSHAIGLVYLPAQN